MKSVLVVLEGTWLGLCVAMWLLFGMWGEAIVDGCKSCDSTGEVFFQFGLAALQTFAVGAVVIALLTAFGWALVREVRRIWFSQSG
jgi:hypothetical protein